MEEIFSNRPNNDIELANNNIKTYILLLERKLQSNCILSGLNKGIEKKYLDQQDELHLLRLQDKENSKNNELHRSEIETLQKTNADMYAENKKLKYENSELLKDFTLLKEIDKRNKTSTATSTPNSTQIHQGQIKNVGNNANATSVLVKGITEQQLNSIPKVNIINMGRHMDVKLTDKDVVKVSRMERKYYQRYNYKPKEIILIVQLLTPELKVEFLRNKQKLKAIQYFDHIEIKDYVSDEVYNLYQYAKILKNNDYAQIYWRNNSVYVKKTRSTLCEPILIKSKEDVDALIFF